MTSYSKLVRDPFFQRFLFQIEQSICTVDNDAKSEGVVLSDSQVRSALVKAKKLVQGASPQVSRESAPDRFLWVLIQNIVHAPDGLIDELQPTDGVPLSDAQWVAYWLKALDTVMESIKSRKSSSPGSRVYLDFVHGFID